MDQAGARLLEILQHADKLGVSPRALVQLDGVNKLLTTRSRKTSQGAFLPALAGVVSVTLALVYIMGLHTQEGFSRAWLKWNQQDLYGQMCTIPMPDQLLKVMRPPEDCSMCQGLEEVEKVSKIMPSQFEDIYAYSGRPVVITDAMDNWTAQHIFSFQFFKSVYEESYQVGCQFFPYQTEFTELREVFNMTEERASMKDGTKPWYIGWSNCDDRVARILRKHYGRPYFLPPTAENKKVDWIFMGSPGYGAHLHVDNVEHPSWQAQLRGRKKWTLEPPPECYYRCASLEVTVEPGEIIVLDTNRWYHKTLIVSDEMSITVGAEYD